MQRRHVRILQLGPAGNIGSLGRALTHVGAQVEVVSEVEALESADAIVLPGVGSFADASQRVGAQRAQLVRLLLSRPSLGICLGMQLLADIGMEFGECQGLGLFAGTVRRMDISGPLPHYGWRNVERRSETPLFHGVDHDAEFYFMHSFAMQTDTGVIATSMYGDHRFASAVQRDQLFGVQFHPERSRDAGLAVLHNFVGLAA